MTTFGKYDLIEPIATGGMAQVFKAVTRGDVGFERVVAIKRILAHLAADEEFVSMFVDEAKIAVQLTHSNIAQIHDLGCHEGSYYMAVEYVHGRDLRAVSNAEGSRGGAVPIQLACFVVMKVAEALDYAHRAEGRDGRPLNVIHRDVSPQNVLISFDGDVKVIDFGLAKAAGRSTQTQAGILKGKLAYLSPEQAKGEGIDQRSDIYALGIVFFELLTGQRLFLRDNDLDTVMAVREGRVPPPRSIASDISYELEAIVLRALEADRSARYQRAQQLHDDLEAFLYRSGMVVTRRHVANYMRELFPEDMMESDQVEELLGVELLDDANEPLTESIVPEPSGLVAEPDDVLDEDVVDATGESSLPPSRASWDDTREIGPNSVASPLPYRGEPIPTKHGLAAPGLARRDEPRSGVSSRSEEKDDQAAHTRTTARHEDVSLARATVEARVDDDHDVHTIDEPIEAIPELRRATTTSVHIDEGPMTVVAPTNERDTWPVPAASGAHPAPTLDDLIAQLPDYADASEEGESTTVTTWSDETTKPSGNDPDDGAARRGRHRAR